MILERRPAGRRARLFAGSVHTFELPALAETLRAEEYYHWHGCDGVTLLETPDLRVYLEVLREGVAAPPHADAEALTIQIKGGELRFQAEEEILYRREGEILVLHSFRPHSLEATQDTVLLVTSSPSRPGAPSSSPGLAHSITENAVGVTAGNWATVQNRYPADWPVEAGDEQC